LVDSTCPFHPTYAATIPRRAISHLPLPGLDFLCDDPTRGRRDRRSGRGPPGTRRPPRSLVEKRVRAGSPNKSRSAYGSRYREPLRICVVESLKQLG